MHQQQMNNQSASCPVCGQEGRFRFRGRDRLYEVTDFSAAMYRCQECRSLFQWPVPDRTQLAGFYPSGYWQERRENNLMTRLQERYIDWMLSRDPMAWIGGMGLPEGADFLDIGCSRGDWLAKIAALGYRVRGLEADPRAVVYARRFHGLEVEQVDADAWQPEPESFHGLSFFHLLEHLRGPVIFMEKCRTALKPGGKILLRVPNLHCFQYTLTGKRWKGLEIPRHLVLFNPKSLVRLLQNKGFEVERISTWSLRDGPPALTSSVFPWGEPTRQQVLGKKAPWLTVIYLMLNLVLTPLERIAAIFGKGAMITVIARKC